MSGVNHLLQILRCAETAGGSKEAGNVIAEGTIIRVLLNGHYLNGVVAVLLDTGQHVLREFLVGTDFLGILSHTHVALVNQQRRLVGLKGLFLPLVGLFGVPHLRREDLRLVVLYDATAPGGNTLAFSPIPLHLHLIKLTVFEGFFREFQLPVAGSFNALALVFLVLLPVVEVTNEVDFCGVRCPLAEHPALGELVETEIEVTTGQL